MKIEQIMEARSSLRGIINNTPLDFSQNFSDIYGGRVYLKPENLQKTGSFKVRGAYNCISKLTVEEKKRGIIAFSSGNHAQGVAYAASKFNINATIVMPVTAPESKVNATRGYGASVIQHGRHSEEMKNKVKELQAKNDYILIHPFNDENVIAGQGTVGLEILEENPGVEAIIVPVAGGGLLSGISVAAKSLNPDIKIYGAQPEQSNSMYKSYKAKKICSKDNIQTIADALIAKRPEKLTLDICLKYVEDIFLVSENEIKNTCYLIAERAKYVVEPSGAVALAAVLNNKVPRHDNIVVILTGGNADLSILGDILKSGIR